MQPNRKKKTIYQILALDIGDYKIVISKSSKLGKLVNGNKVFAEFSEGADAVDYMYYCKWQASRKGH